MSLASRFEESEFSPIELSPIAVDWDLGFTRAPTKSALLYWRSLLAGRAMPDRHDLDPRAMARFLAHVNLVNVREDAAGSCNYVVMLQGSHSREVLGSVQGRKLSEIFAQAAAVRWRGCFDLSRASQVPVRLVTRANTTGRNCVASETLIAPLGSPTGVVALFWVFAAWYDGAIAAPETGLRAGAA